MNTKESARLEKYLHRLSADFPFFIEELWKDRGLESVAKIGEMERDICRYAAYGDSRPGQEARPKRRGILAPRSFGKTHLVSAALGLWRLMGNPNYKVLISSKSEKEAIRTVFLIRKWVQYTWFLKFLSPDTRRRTQGGKEQRDAATQFDVGPSKEDRVASIRAVGIGGQLEGARAHMVIGDDVETDSNTMTLEARDNLDRRVREFNSILYKGGEILYVGTYHHEESLYIKLNDRGYQFRTWPLVVPGKNEHQLNLAPFVNKAIEGGAKPGDILAPHRFDPEYVAERQAEGQSHWLMQYQLVANLGDTLRYPLTLRDFIVYDQVDRDTAPISIVWGMNNGQGSSTRIEDIPSLGFGSDGFHGPVLFSANQTAPYNGTKMWIDPSGRGKDKTGYAIVGQLNGFLWVKAVGGLEGGYDRSVLETLAMEARHHRATEIYIEDNFGQGMFQPLFEPVLAASFIEDDDDEEIGTQWPTSMVKREHKGWKAVCETIRVTGQKEIRIIDALEPPMNSHRIVIDRNVAQNTELQRQLTRITRQRNSLPHDDELESLAMCVLQWQYELSQDPEGAADRLRSRWLADKQREHLQLAGVDISEPRYFSTW
jgi:hypothetical protein